MARPTIAYVATSTRPRHDSPDHLSASPPPSPSPSPPSSPTFPPLDISSPLGAPFYPVAEDYGGYKFKPLPVRLSSRMSMPSEVSLGWYAHWLSRLRSALRLLVVVLSGAVLVFLIHTLEIFRGNTYLDLRSGELPMTWPARTNLVPTLLLFAVATANFLASVSIMTLSCTRRFSRPIRSRDLYRVVAGSLSVLFWGAAIAAFALIEKHSKASLGRYACTHKNVLSNGRYQYLAICEEQGVAFYLAIGAASAELVILLTLAVSASFTAKHRAPVYKEKGDYEKRRSISFGVTGRFS